LRKGKQVYLLWANSLQMEMSTMGGRADGKRGPDAWMRARGDVLVQWFDIRDRKNYLHALVPGFN
jgi:hypothetical protein